MPPQAQAQGVGFNVPANAPVKPGTMAKGYATSKHLLQKASHDEVQAKTFTRWWNSELPPTHQIADLETDLSTGVAPMVLLTRMTGVEHKHKPNVVSRIQAIENLTLFLRAVKALGIQLTNISAEDIADGKRTLILGLTYKMMYHFMGSGAEKSTNDEVLKWARANAREHGANIEGWTGAGLTDGRALCTLLHQYDTSAIDLAALPDPQSTPDAQLLTLQKAFRVAEAHFGAPALLDATDYAGEGGGSEDIEAKSMQVYMLRLRQALRAHAAARRKDAQDAVVSFVAEAEAAAARMQEAGEKLRGEKAKADALDRRQRKDINTAEVMLTELDGTFRAREKVELAAKHMAILEDGMPAVQQKVTVCGDADAGIHDPLTASDQPDGTSACTGKGAAESIRAANEKAIKQAAAAVAEQWKALEAIESEYSACLWSILREKETDELVAAAAVIGKELEVKANAWVERLRDPQTNLALKYDAKRLRELGPAKADATNAVKEATESLLAWVSKGEERLGKVSPSLATLDERRAAYTAQYKAAAQRREEEARDAPEDYNLKLDAAWASMQEASSALRRRALEILDWQQHHVEANADAMRAADELLLPNLGKHAPQAFSPSFTRRPSLVDGTMVPTARPDAAMNPNIAIEEESGGCVIL